MANTSIVVHETYYIEFDSETALHEAINAARDNLEKMDIRGDGWQLLASDDSPRWDYIDNINKE